MELFSRDNTKKNWAGVIFGALITILFQIPLGGISGFMMLAQYGGWSLVLGIVLQLILTYVLVGNLIFLIKRW